jgi:hypothetical protein
VNFAAITLCVASQRVFVVYFVIDSVRKLLDTPLYTSGKTDPSRGNTLYCEPINLFDLKLGRIATAVEGIHYCTCL